MVSPLKNVGEESGHDHQCGILLYKGYQGMAQNITAILPKKTANGLLLTFDRQGNEKIAEDRITLVARYSFET